LRERLRGVAYKFLKATPTGRSPCLHSCEATAFGIERRRMMATLRQARNLIVRYQTCDPTDDHKEFMKRIEYDLHV